MKLVRKVMAFVTTCIMAFSMMSVTAFAANADKESGKGGDGALTITNANPDQTYQLCKVFEAVVNDKDNEKVSYKPLAGKTIPTNDYFKVVNGYIIVQDAAKDTNDTSALSAGAIAWLSNNYQTIGEYVTEVTPSEEGEQKITGLPFGYYYVTTTTGTAISVDTTNKNAEIQDKNPGTTIDKTITGVLDGSVTEDKDKALAQVGTTVDYEVRIQIAQNAKSYVFTDVMTDGLSYKSGSMKVYVVDRGSAVPENANAVTQYGELTESSDAKNNNPDVEIVFSDELLAANNGKDIVLRYQATVNGNAIVATDANPNKATIYWGDTTDKLKDEDAANVYSAQVTVKKVDGDGAALEGAGFKLKNSGEKWYKNNNGIVSWEDSETAGTEIYPVKNDGTDAVASFTGLADGTYTLVETTVPDGYNKANDEEVTIEKAKENDFTKELTVGKTIENNQGIELPSTGGIGTTIFYIVGGGMVAGAVVFLLTKRRMAGKE